MISWKNLLARKGIKIDKWLNAHNIKTLKQFKEKVLSLNVSINKEDEFAVSKVLNETKKAKDDTTKYVVQNEINFEENKASSTTNVARKSKKKSFNFDSNDKV